METDNLILKFVVVFCRLRKRSHSCLDTSYKPRRERSIASQL